jgi:hypothetical protein
MPLANYGVLAGTFNRFEFDPPVGYGQYYHGFIFVNAPPPAGGAAQAWRCAVDVKMPDGVVEYARVKMKREELENILSLSTGFHALESNAESGALDYARNTAITRPLGCLALFFAFFNTSVWRKNEGGSVLADLQGTLVSVKRLYVFGQRFHNNDPDEWGMHDVHMNQGDPPGSPWFDSNGIWQDGGVLVEHDDDTVEGFFIKFLTQTLKTDSNGHPVP